MPKHYDPLTHANCQGQPFAQSYWTSTISLPDALSPPTTPQTFEVAIVGGGFSGLLTAYYLASHYNISCCILEANQVGFGASGRNAGFVLKGAGRLSYPHIAKKWGIQTCKDIYSEYSNAVSRVASLINQHAIQCDKQQNGYLKVAHNIKAMQNLNEQALFMQKLGDSAEFLTSSQLQNHYMRNVQAYGAMRLTDGFGVNPLKLVLGYREMALNAGVRIYEHSLVQDTKKQNESYTLYINDIPITAKNIIYTGNAYNNKLTHSDINNRYLPILSSIMVTRALTESELAQTGLKTHQVTMDTRTLKYYYRLLPDNRILFGGRGAVFATQQHDSKYLNGLKKGLAACFPCLKNINHDYYWSGFIAATFDDMPHVYFNQNIGYILGYCGAGVSFSAQAAFRLAQQIAGYQPPNLPMYKTPVPYFPFPQFRRFSQMAYYQYASLLDSIK
ncbi:FAD-binding oxidoreductase [Pseudoalteromonas sp. MMG013]|uniref:NAD(P)/FAD-dependent oxidoreductase n=1 Tax=Pseudoalteromonas sp. MMG013 TaxID=2822687 RepID=UPI001B35A499|nr:FAD-dependent oxidoreductase [Pseudoalteromonas sp. MMG013]MBQ4860616.1 FAD-binding oxidoreductase [Pseudoalteromonas sp. MMG013]